jgi:hypothetical protein
MSSTRASVITLMASSSISERLQAGGVIPIARKSPFKVVVRLKLVNKLHPDANGQAVKRCAVIAANGSRCGGVTGDTAFKMQVAAAINQAKASFALETYPEALP